MDVEAKQLLRELRDIAARCEARDNEWIAESRENSKRMEQLWIESDAKNRKFARQSAGIVWILLGGLAVMVAISLFWNAQ